MRRLDSAQLAAAKGGASIQLTLAGPGSGKTSTLTGRFVHLIRRGVDPARILAVTFTKKAADEIRRRIVRLLELPPRYATTDAIPAGANMANVRAFGPGVPLVQIEGTGNRQNGASGSVGASPG